MSVTAGHRAGSQTGDSPGRHFLTASRGGPRTPGLDLYRDQPASMPQDEVHLVLPVPPVALQRQAKGFAAFCSVHWAKRGSEGAGTCYGQR